MPLYPMTTFGYTVSCVYCEHFQYSPDTIEIDPWKEEFCAVHTKIAPPTIPFVIALNCEAGFIQIRYIPTKAAIRPLSCIMQKNFCIMQKTRVHDAEKILHHPKYKC